MTPPNLHNSRKSKSKSSNPNHGTSSRSSIQMLPIISGLVEKQNPEIDLSFSLPFEVIVSLTIHDIQAHLMKNCTENDPPCPIILIERLGFEMKKRYTETELQVLVSPSYLITSDNVSRPSREKHLKQGHLLLSALQVRGHAMFSNEGCGLEEDTLEYAWLLEIQLGKISGKMTLPLLRCCYYLIR